MSSIGSCVSTFGLQVVALIGKVMGILGGGALLEEVCEQGQDSWFSSLAPLPFFLSASCKIECDLPASWLSEYSPDPADMSLLPWWVSSLWNCKPK